MARPPVFFSKRQRSGANNTNIADEIEEGVAAEAQLKRRKTIDKRKLRCFVGHLVLALLHEIKPALNSHCANFAHCRASMEQGQIAKLNSLDKIRIILTKSFVSPSTLKRLPRVAGTELTPVCLEMVIQDAIELMSNQISRTKLYASAFHLPNSNLRSCRTIRIRTSSGNLIRASWIALSSSPLKQLSYSSVEHDERS